MLILIIGEEQYVADKQSLKILIIQRLLLNRKQHASNMVAPVSEKKCKYKSFESLELVIVST